MEDKGFTLIETMVSIAIITIVFFAMVSVFPFSLNVNKKASNLTAAAYLAQAGAEAAISLSYDDLEIGNIEPKSRLSDDQNNFLYAFERETNVNYVDGNLDDSLNDTGLKKIEVKIYWYNPFMPTEQNYTINTLISKN